MSHVRPPKDIIDINEWFKNRGIPTREARGLVFKVKQNYPHLSGVLKRNEGVLPELELIQLIFDVQSKRFPPPK